MGSKKDLETSILSENGRAEGVVVVEEKEGTLRDMDEMRRMGKKQQFKVFARKNSVFREFFAKCRLSQRNFNFMSIFGFTMILLSTWEGLLGTAAFGLGNGGTAGLIYMYLVAVVGFTLVIASLAEMASMAPTAGGQYHWISEFAGASVQKPLSFFIGWLCVLGWQTGVAIGTFLAATEIQGLVVLNYDNYVYERWHGTLMTIAMILFVAVFNTLFARYLPLVESLALFLHLAGFVAIVIPLWVLGKRSPSHEVWTGFSDEGGWGSIGLACLVGIISPATALIGADAATHMSEELKDASRSLPRAMFYTAVFNGSLGLIMVITFCYTVGDVNSVLATPTGYPFIQVFYNATGSKAGATGMTSIMIILSAANALTNVAAASRQLFAFARDKGVPFSGWFQKVPLGWNIPLNAIMFTVFFSSLLSLINIGSNVAFNQIVSLGVSALLSSYIVSISCITVKRIRGERLLDSRFSLGRWGLPINIASLAFVSFAFVITFFPPFANPPLDAMNWSCAIYGGVLLIALVYYIFWARYSYVGPVEYVRRSS